MALGILLALAAIPVEFMRSHEVTAASPAAVSWVVPRSDFPAGTAVATYRPTAANLKSLFGQFHKNGYASLQRVRDSGAIEIAALKMGGHELRWSFVVS